MRKEILFIWAALAVFACGAAVGAGTDPVLLVSNETNHSSASVVTAKMGGQIGVAALFTGTDTLHYYATGDFTLELTARGEGLTFGKTVMAKPENYYDKFQEMEVKVHSGKFECFIPLESYPPDAKVVDAEVVINGQACTNRICFRPFEKVLAVKLDLAAIESWQEVKFEPDDAAAAQKGPGGDGPLAKSSSTRAGIVLLLAVLAGITFNIMPCVLPVLPVIIMRLMEQSKENSKRRIELGLAFCGGIILFFAGFAVIAAIINIATGEVFSISDLLRYPAAAAVMFVLVVVFGLFMFDVFSIGIPSSVASKSGSGKGALGSVGMGFLAAFLSTPCTGAIIAFVMIWAQTVHVIMSILAFTLMGVGMAIPYAILVAVPALLDKVPRPGAWMELFRKSMGFVLIFIAIKLALPSLPKETLLSVLKFTLSLSFCVWMWGSWVGFTTPAKKKWTVRLIAVVLAVGAGWLFLSAKTDLVDWQEYDQAIINKAEEQGQPVLVKFTAGWCANCAVVDRRVYHDEGIAELIESKGVLAIKGDTTTKKLPAYKGMTEVYGEPGYVPVTIMIMPDGSIERLRGMFDKDELAEILETLPSDK